MQRARRNPPVFDDQIGPAQSRHRLDAQQQVEATAERRSVDQDGVGTELARGRTQRCRGRENGGARAASRTRDRHDDTVSRAVLTVLSKLLDKPDGGAGQRDHPLHADGGRALPIGQFRLALGDQDDADSPGFPASAQAMAAGVSRITKGAEAQV